MQLKQHRTILLIGKKSVRLESVFSALRQTGYNILFAGDGSEGFRLLRRERPDLIISEINLPVMSGLELCRMIRTDRELRATPLMFLSNLQQDCVEILRAGADDCLTEVSNPQYLEAKIEWLIERKNSENRLIQYYQILRDRQQHITQIIKGTADLFEMSNLENATAFADRGGSREAEEKINKKIELGMNMTGALANLLEEQITAFESWGRLQGGDCFAHEQDFTVSNSEPSYREVMYSFAEDDLPPN